MAATSNQFCWKRKQCLSPCPAFLSVLFPPPSPAPPPAPVHLLSVSNKWFEMPLHCNHLTSTDGRLSLHAHYFCKSGVGCVSAPSLTGAAQSPPATPRPRRRCRHWALAKAALSPSRSAGRRSVRQTVSFRGAFEVTTRGTLFFNAQCPQLPCQYK